MANIIVSVIIPVYNSEKYLRKCIDSILIQPFKEFEIILVNDGSKDTSGDICDLYALKDKRIQVYHQNNGGVSHARNSGLAKAKGEWVYFVDSDDSIQPSTFDIFFKNAKLSDVDIVQFGYRRIFSHNQIVEYCPAEEKLFNTIEEYYSNTSIHRFSLWVHFIKRSIISKNQVQFSKNVHYAEDLEFTIKCYLLSNKVMTLNSMYYNYHYNEGSAMNKAVEFSSALNYSIVLENLITFIESNKVNSSAVFIEKRLIYFIKTYLVRISVQPKWYYNLRTYQQGYNRIFSLTKSILGFKLNRAYLSINRISIIPCLLYLIVRINLLRNKRQ